MSENLISLYFCISYVTIFFNNRRHTMTESKGENWVDVEANDNYRISSRGRIQRKDSKYILNPWKSGSGYASVTLWKNGKKKNFSAHRLSAIAFVENDDPENRPTVDHTTADRMNPDPKDLVWASYREQNLRAHNRPGAKKRKRKGRERPVNQFTLDDRFVKRHRSVDAASTYSGVSVSQIIKCAKNTVKNPRKFFFEYADTEDLPGEKWRKIKGFQNARCSSLGRIEFKNGRRDYGSLKENGYREVELLSTDGKRTSCFVHRLVAIAFLGRSPPDKPFVNHKDGNKANNAIENLEWCDSEENAKHAVENGLFPLCKPVIQMDLNDKFIRLFESASDAAEELTGKRRNCSGITKVCRSVRPTAYGFKWKYAEK